MSDARRTGTTVCEHGKPTGTHCFFCCKRLDDCPQCALATFRLTPVAKAAMDLIMPTYKERLESSALTLSDLVTLFQRGADWQRERGST